MTIWPMFEKTHDFENTVFDLTCRSLDLLAASAYKDETFTGFAFNVTLPGVSLSFDTAADNQERDDYYPPDWPYECMEYEVEAIGQLWESGYGDIRCALEALIDNTDEDADLDALEAGFMHSMRKVMLRLETERAFERIQTGARLWKLVTQVDADTDAEEASLDALRSATTAVK